MQVCKHYDELLNYIIVKLLSKTTKMMEKSESQDALWCQVSLYVSEK